MPVSNGVAISIHANTGRLGEYSVQRQGRLKRVTSYIRVPTPKIKDGKVEQSTFAISICLLREGMIVPYSDQPSDIQANPDAIPVSSHLRRSMIEAHPVKPWTRMSADENETVAAYIYFDGRTKEEVATLLRPGDETWVNSRWVSQPDGGLAEREFIFREVGIDKALGNLGLTDKEAAAKRADRAERAAARVKRRHERREAAKAFAERNNIDIDDIPHSSSEESSAGEEEMAESAGQIKIVLFRVIATGDVKKGEYSPQFTAADDNDDAMMEEPDGADLSHTAAFAKPKSLDPSTISTQTVQGVDGPDSPFATFTFLYRGERQLRKMGIIKDEPAKTPKRNSKADFDFSHLAPLTPKGTVGFTTRQDQMPNGKKDRNRLNGKTKKRKSSSPESSDEDSDAPPNARKISPPHSAEGGGSGDELDPTHKRNYSNEISPAEQAKLDNIAEGLRKTKLKRQHSAEPEDHERRPPTTPHANYKSRSPPQPFPDSVTPPAELEIKFNEPAAVKDIQSTTGKADTSKPTQLFGTRTPSLSISQNTTLESQAGDEPVVGSPFKRHRTSMDGDAFGGRAAAGIGMSSAGIGGSFFDFKKMSDLQEGSSSEDEKAVQSGSKKAETKGLGFGGLLGVKEEEAAELAFGPPLLEKQV